MVCWLPTITLIAFVYKDDVELSEGRQFLESLHNWWQFEPHVWSWTYNVRFVLNIPLGGGGFLGKHIEQSLLNIPLCHPLPLPLFYCCRYLKWHLLDHKAIHAQAIPHYFVAWVDKSSHLCNFITLELNIYTLHILQYCPCFIHCSPTLHPIHKGVERLLVEPTIDFTDTHSLDFQEEPHELLVSGDQFKKDSKCKGELKNIVPPKREIMVSTPPQEHLSGSLIVTTPSLSLKHLQHVAHNLKTYWRGNCWFVVKVAFSNICVLFKVTTIMTLMENGGDKHPIMLKTFEFLPSYFWTFIIIIKYRLPLHVFVSYLDIHTICHPIMPWREGRIGLINNDLLEGLLALSVSSPLFVIPIWRAHTSSRCGSLALSCLFTRVISHISLFFRGTLILRMYH